MFAYRTLFLFGTSKYIDVFLFSVSKKIYPDSDNKERKRSLPSSGSTKPPYNKKADNPFELSALVAGGGLEPPTFGL